jgi:hypothetical protein
LNSKLAQFNRFFKAIAKITMVGLAIFLFILISAVLSLRIPAVNNYVTQRAVTYTSDLLGYPVAIGSIYIDWYDHIIIENVVLKDREKNDMIYLGEGQVDIYFNKLLHGEFEIENCIVKNGGVSLYNFESDSNVNIVEFIETLSTKFSGPNDLDTTTTSFIFKIPYAKLHNMKFRYIDQTEKVYRERFDENHFGFDSVYSYVHNFEIRSDTLQLTAQKLRTVEYRTRKHVKELNTFFRFHDTGMEFENSYAHVGNSTVHANLTFKYDSIDNLKNFTTDVDLDAKLTNCHIYVTDLAVFSSFFDEYHDLYKITGDVTGRINKLKGKNLDVCFGKQSYFKGNAAFNNLPNIEDLFINCAANKVLIAIPDLKQYIAHSVYNDIAAFKYFSGTGKYVGFFHDFITQGTYATDLGVLKTDLYLNLPDRLHPNVATELSGRLETRNFKIGKLIGHEDAESISFKGEIKAEGMTLESSSVKLDAAISSMIYAGYNYKNIVTKASVSNRMFNGFISIKDSNLLASLDGKIDFREDWKIFNFKMNCERANLYNLNLGTAAKFPLLKTSATLNIKALNLAEIEGELYTGKTYLRYANNKEVYIDSAHAEIHKIDGQRLFTLESDLVDGTVKGDFDFVGLQQSMQSLTNEIILKIKNEESEITEYYAKKAIEGTSAQQVAEFSFLVHDLNQFFDIYIPGTFMTPGSTIDGSYLANNTKNTFDFKFTSDTLFYNFYELRKNDFSFSLEKHPLKNNTVFDYKLTSESQKFKNIVPTKNMHIYGNGINDSLFVHSAIEQDSIENKIVLNNLAVFEKDVTNITFDSSYVLIGEDKWDINKDGAINIASDQEIILSNLKLSFLDQFLSVNGSISNKPEKSIDVLIDNFNINTILSFISSIPIQGNMNGKVVLSNLLKLPQLQSDFNILALEIDDIAIGDLEGKSNYNTTTNLVEIDCDIYNNNNTIASVNGYLNVSNPQVENDISLHVDLSQTNLNFLNPFLKDIIEDIEGEAEGAVDITGKYDSPSISGETYVDRGKFRIPYLGTTYTFNDKIIFDDNLIGFKNLNLKDYKDNVCIINGGIYHDLFQKFVFNFKGDMKEFQVLNTTEKDNTLFYGSAFGTGTWEFLGTPDNINITANASMLKSSKMYIPMDSYEDVQEKEYIRFINHDSSAVVKKESTNLSGIKLDLNINIEQGTYSEIIFDKQAGDIIKSYGGGDLKFNVDTRGDFSMFGTFFIDKGTYNFTLANIINKEFSINKGSKITWTGSPYEAESDINAEYHQYVSFAPFILDSLTRNSYDAKRKYPVDLDLKLNGSILHPEFTLGITILDKFPSSLSSDVTAFRNTLATNPNELNRQVFSLLLFKQFSPANEFTGVGGAAQNLNELLSNQLSTWLSQVDPNLQIQVDVTQLAQNSTNNFNMRFSYTLLDGRLRVSMDGLVQGQNQNSGSSSQSSSSSSNVIGEWTVEYFLTEDGKLRLKLFNKANQTSVISNSNNNMSTSTGFSVTYTQEFDKLSELFKSKKKKEAEEEERKQKEALRKKEEELQNTILEEENNELVR